MKTVKDKYLVMGADFAGYPLKETVKKHLEKKVGRFSIWALNRIAIRTIPTLCFIG